MTNKTKKLIDSLFQELESKHPVINFFELLGTASSSSPEEKLAHISSYITELEIEVSLRNGEVQKQQEEIERAKEDVRAARKEIADLKSSFHRKNAEREVAFKEMENQLERLQGRLKQNRNGMANEKEYEKERMDALQATLDSLKREYMTELESLAGHFAKNVSLGCKDCARLQNHKGVVNEPVGKAANKESRRGSSFRQLQEVRSSITKLKSVGDKEEAP